MMNIIIFKQDPDERAVLLEALEAINISGTAIKSYTDLPLLKEYFNSHPADSSVLITGTRFRNQPLYPWLSRLIEKNPKVSIVVVTGESDEGVLKTYRNLPAEILEEPVTFDSLQPVIEKLAK